MSGLFGLLAAILSSSLGGTAIGATRYLAGALDPITIGVIRFAGGFLILLPIAFLSGGKWPERRDRPYVGALGFLFFALFPVLFNASLIFTTAARGALALSTLPLLTMLVAALLGIERLTLRKTIGVFIAMAGVAIALATGLSHAPAGAWRGDILMVGAAFCMALYNVWSRPFISRSGPIPFAAAGMGVGAIALLLLAPLVGTPGDVLTLSGAQWIACAYLAVICGALIFYLWAYALGKTSPTLVALSVTFNPVTASIFGALLLNEPITLNVVIGLIAVIIGIVIASAGRATPLD
jgi:drug/metabolite transporter (DMT)-like permease